MIFSFPGFFFAMNTCISPLDKALACRLSSRRSGRSRTEKREVAKCREEKIARQPPPLPGLTSPIKQKHININLQLDNPCQCDYKMTTKKIDTHRRLQKCGYFSIHSLIYVFFEVGYALPKLPWEQYLWHFIAISTKKKKHLFFPCNVKSGLCQVRINQHPVLNQPPPPPIFFAI